jgi:hypothetical protein
MDIEIDEEKVDEAVLALFVPNQLQGQAEYHKALVRKILVAWGFDGLKLDGQHMNGVPPCYNPTHHHKRPEDSVEALPDFFHEIYDAAQKAKTGSLVEFCPCGTAYSFFTCRISICPWLPIREVLSRYARKAKPSKT